MLNFGANLTLLFNEFTWKERFQAAKNAGFQYIEIQFPYDLPLDFLQRELNTHQLTLQLINLPAGDFMQGGLGIAAHPDRQAEFDAALTHARQYATALNVKIINVLAGRTSTQYSYQHHLDTLVKRVRQAAVYFAPFGITVTCEALNPFDMSNCLIKTGNDMIALKTAVNENNFKHQVDVYHFARQNLDALTFITEHIHDVAHIQFADIPNRSEPFSGEYDFLNFFSQLSALNFQGIAAAEYRPSTDTLNSLHWLKPVQTIKKNLSLSVL